MNNTHLVQGLPAIAAVSINGPHSIWITRIVMMRAGHFTICAVST
jgi:hypothetical protein